MTHVAVLSSSTRFDVVCVGEAFLAAAGSEIVATGGAVRTATALSREQLRVGLCAVLPDDPRAHPAIEHVRARGVAVDGVAVSGMFRETPAPIPDAWSADLLVVSGVTPALARAARLCRDARAVRRRGGMVVVDLNARAELWRESDARVVHALLRESHLVRCSTADAMVLWMDFAAIRAAMNPSAVLIVTDGPGAARAHGPFGDARVAPPRTRLGRLRPGAGDAFTASVVAQLVRPTEKTAWDRVLATAHVAAWSFGSR